MTTYPLPDKEKRREGSLNDTYIAIIIKTITQQVMLHKTNR